MNLIEQQLCEIGFRKPNRGKLEVSYKYPLGRGRFLSAMCLGTPNESVWLCYKEDEGNTEIDDLICMHNYDYDGKLTKEKVKYLIEYFEKTQSSWAFEELKAVVKELISVEEVIE